MKQKKYKWTIYVIILALVSGLAYVATMDLTPVQQQVEKNINVF